MLNHKAYDEGGSADRRRKKERYRIDGHHRMRKAPETAPAPAA